MVGRYLWIHQDIQLLCGATPLTLSERITALSSDGDSHPHRNHNTELGGQRLQRWRSQPPFSDDLFFAQRLALDGIDEARFAHILGEPVESLHKRLSSLPTWLAALVEAYAQPASAFANPPPGEEVLGFLELVQPLIDQACERLHARVAVLANKWPALPFDPKPLKTCC